MIKPVLFSLLFLILQQGVFAQDTLIVPLKAEPGNKYFLENHISGKLIANTSAYNLVHSQLELFNVRRFYFDELQHNYIKFIKGGRSDSGFIRRIKKYHLDTSSLSTTPLKNYLDVLSGFGKDGRFICIADFNFNQDFIDDQVWYFTNPYRVPTDSLWEELHSYPYHKIGIQIYRNGQVQLKNYFITFEPWMFFKFYRSHPEKIQSIKDSTRIFIKGYQHYTGNFLKNGIRYHIFVHNDNTGIRLLNNNQRHIRLRVKNRYSHPITNYSNKKYLINDLIPIGTDLYKVVYYTPFGNKIVLKDNKENKNYNPWRKVTNIHTTDMKGNPFSLNKLKGNYVLLDFWATWCGSCLETHTYMKGLFKKYKDDRLIMVSVALENDSNKVAHYIKEKKIGWINLFESLSEKPGSLYVEYRIISFPTFILISPKGEMVFRDIGIKGYRRLEKYLETVL